MFQLGPLGQDLLAAAIEHEEADINEDGIADYHDLKILVENWLSEGEIIIPPVACGGVDSETKLETINAEI